MPTTLPNIRLVENIRHTNAVGESIAGGSDLEFADLVVPDGSGGTKTITVGALGVYNQGMHLYDVTDPENVELLGVYRCRITQASFVDTFAGFDRLSVFDATNVVLQ
ncbi:MAG: hypothetical protein ACR2HR_14635 [Euzebya sp.]